MSNSYLEDHHQKVKYREVLKLVVCQVGHWDGSFALIEIPGADTTPSSAPGGRQLQRLWRIKSESEHEPQPAPPLRAVAWIPQAPAHPRDTTAHYIFATAGHSATIKVWDKR